MLGRAMAMALHNGQGMISPPPPPLLSNLCFSSSSPSSLLPAHLRGVVFDMDGTLTLPAIDFAHMYRAVLGDDHPLIRSGSSIDILHEIEDWSPEKKRAAYGIIASFEQEALQRLQIAPGVMELCQFLDAKKIRRGIITRNVKESVDLFHTRLGIRKFSPAISREFRPYKPSPASLLHICNTWGVPPAQVMMVGDCARDDVVCGNRAGAITCLLDEWNRFDVASMPAEQRPNFKVKSLLEVLSLMQLSMGLES